MKSLTVLAFSISLLASVSGVVAGPNERQAHAIAAAAGQITFHTLDGDVQQVNAEEIWRVRGTITRDEPPGAVVIDYGFERVFVKETLENIVNKIREQRDLRRFTLPGGAPIYIAPDKIIGVNRPIPHQHHQNSKAVIIAREGEQQVQESRQAVAEAIK